MKPRIDLLHAAPHPFWIPVVAAALVHGIVPGVFATLLAGLCNWFFAGTLITTEDDYYDVMFKTFKEPVLWLFAVLVLGTLRDRVEDERRTLARQRDEAKEDLGRVVDHASELRERIHDLERVIALSEMEAERSASRNDAGGAVDSPLAPTRSGAHGEGPEVLSGPRTDATSVMADTDDLGLLPAPLGSGASHADAKMGTLTHHGHEHDGPECVPDRAADRRSPDGLDEPTDEDGKLVTEAAAHRLPDGDSWRGPALASGANDKPSGDALTIVRRDAPHLVSVPSPTLAEKEPSHLLDPVGPPMRVPLSRRFGLLIRKTPRRAGGGQADTLSEEPASLGDVAPSPDTSYAWRWVSLWELKGNAWIQTEGEGALHYPDAGRLLRRMDEEPRIYDSRNDSDRSILPEDALLACPLRIGLGPAAKVVVIGGGHIGEGASLHDLVAGLFEIAARLERSRKEGAVP